MFKQLPPEVRSWILKSAMTSLTSVNPTDKAVDTNEAQPIQLIKLRTPERLRDERRQREKSVAKELRKLPWTYDKEGK